jgi:hypothetical protein
VQARQAKAITAVLVQALGLLMAKAAAAVRALLV